VRIGLISDTHLPSVIRRLDELGPEIGAFLATVDLILHAGDVTAPSVVVWCEQFAPVRVARGNNDLFEHPQLADQHLFEAEGWRIGMVHQLRPEARPIPVLLDEHLGGARVDILIAGDTHRERLEFREDVVFLNPGSPTLPHHKEYRLGTVGLLELTPDSLHAEILLLGHSAGAPNPGIAQQLQLRRVDGRAVLWRF
jgi:hypothetical protein